MCVESRSSVLFFLSGGKGDYLLLDYLWHLTPLWNAAWFSWWDLENSQVLRTFISCLSPLMMARLLQCSQLTWDVFGLAHHVWSQAALTACVKEGKSYLSMCGFPQSWFPHHNPGRWVRQISFSPWLSRVMKWWNLRFRNFISCSWSHSS